MAMSDELKGRYIELINAKTPEEVYRNVRKWTSNLSEKEHLIRSIIFDIHAILEDRLKDVLRKLLSPLIVNWGDAPKFEEHQKKLSAAIKRMSFMRVYELLKPALDAFDRDSIDLALLPEINTLRNDAAHPKDKKLVFRGRSLFADHDAVAELFVSSWTMNKELDKFVEKMIDDPVEFQRVGYNVYHNKPNPLEK